MSHNLNGDAQRAPRRKPPPDLIVEPPQRQQTTSDGPPSYGNLMPSPASNPRPIPNHWATYNGHLPTQSGGSLRGYPEQLSPQGHIEVQSPVGYPEVVQLSPKGYPSSAPPHLDTLSPSIVPYSPTIYSPSIHSPIVPQSPNLARSPSDRRYPPYSPQPPSMPSIPPIPSQNIPSIPARPTRESITRHRRNLSINSTDEDEYSFFNESISHESPKPMGPKEVFDYDVPKITTSRDQYKKRHFQHLSRSNSAETKETQFSLPYPEKDFDLDLDYDSETLAHSLLTTPSKIPQLHTSNSLSHPRLRKLFYDDSSSSSPSPSSSPARRRDHLLRNNTVGSTSPTRYTTRLEYSPSSYRSHSPTKESELSSDEDWTNPFDSENNSLPPSYMDLSYLPDLPPTESKRSSMGSITKQPSRNSINFLAITKKRKEEALPPVPLDLPQLPFTSASLVSQHFSTCESIWLLSSVFQWCLRLRIWLHDLFISEKEFKKALIKLFIYHRRDHSLDVINNIADQTIEDFLRAGAIRLDQDDDLPRRPRGECGILMDENISVSGVLTDLTACYYYGENHTTKEIKLRCFSPRCHLNRIIDYEMEWKTMKIEEIVLGEDWVTHWKLTAIQLKSMDPATVALQSFIFDLLRYEQKFIQRAKCYIEVVGPMFISAAKRLVPGEIYLLNKFEDDMITPGKTLLEIHQKILYEPLLRILMKDGRFVKNLVAIANIYHAWAQEVKNALLKYMSTVPMIESLLEVPALKAWVDREVSTVKRVSDLKVNGHILMISTFNSRYQSLPLQLLEIRKRYDTQEPEYVSLTQTLDTIKSLGSKVNQMKVHADNLFELKKIQKQLTWKSTIAQPSFSLGSENRRFIYRGDLSRKGDLKINTTTNHVILLDNFFIVTEAKTKASPVTYKVVENPIPIELVIVEEKEDPKASSPVEAATPEDIDYAFKVRYAGRGKHDSYTFFTKTKEVRRDWIDRLVKARSKMCQRTEHSVPYKVELISKTCFAYEINNRVTKLPICVPHDPVYDSSMQALQKLQSMGFTNDLYNFPGAKNHIVYSKVQSFCKFQYRDNTYHLVGVSSGLYCCDTKNRWKKLISGDIAQMSVETDISLLIVLGGKQLRYYPLELILNVYFERRKNVTCVSISNEPVAFYSIGLHRDQKMLFYAKRKGNTSTTTNFKVLTSLTDNDGVFSTFSVYKKFYVEAECFGVSIFNTSFAVHTSKGFETLTLDKLQPMSIPEFPYLENKKVDGFRKLQSNTTLVSMDQIRKMVQSTSLKPMGMYKLRNNTEFLLVYSDCAIFTNKHGKLSRFSCLQFDYKTRSIAFENNHLFIICEEAIEVWQISDDVKGPTRRVQTIVGKDITLISSDTLSIAMANPAVLGLQLVFLLVRRN